MQVDVLLEATAPAAPVMSDTVRQQSPPAVNQKIDQATLARIWDYARKSPEEITARIEALDREWDLERVLESNAAALSLAGVALSALVRRRWLLLPAGVLSLMLQHSLMGTSLPAKLLRRVGIRTRREIDAEKYALRLLRGDFDRLKEVHESSHRAIEALRMARS